jgi:hypothetical protein
MQIGCGFRVKEVKGQEYVYFWRYEVRGGRSRQVSVYMGPRRAAETAHRLARATEAYFAAASDDLRRALRRQRDSIAALRA